MKLTVRLSLRGETRNVGPTAGRVYVFTGDAVLSRVEVARMNAVICPLDVTPSSACTLDVPAGSTVTLMAVEGEPSVRGDFRPAEVSDTVRGTGFIEFASWSSSCPVQPERGSCALVVRSDTTIGADFKYMLKLVLWQVGAASLDFSVSALFPTLRIPAEASSILNLVSCSGVTGGIPCTQVRAVGGSPWHRLTIMMPKYTALSLKAGNGVATQLQEWAGPCAPYAGLCFVNDAEQSAIISPYLGDSTLTQAVVTLKSDYWQCPSGPSDRDLGGCSYVKP